MRIKTTIKLFFQNLSLVWKVAFYKMLTYGLTLLLLVLSARPVGATLKNEGFVDAFIDMFKINESTFINLGTNISSLCEMFFSIISSNWQTLSFSIVMFIFVLTFFNYFINALADIPVCEILYGKMSCNANFGFCGCFIRNLKKSLAYSAVKMFSTFIVDAFVVAILFGVLSLCKLSALLTWFAPLIAVLIFIILFALRKVIFACFTPNMVINGYNVFKSLAQGVKMGCKKFIYSYGSAIAISVCLVSLNVFIAIFTLGAGILVTVPATYVILNIFNMVIFYSNNGMYFYIGTHDIQDQSKGIKKLEQLDTVKDLKNII